MPQLATTSYPSKSKHDGSWKSSLGKYESPNGYASQLSKDDWKSAWVYGAMSSPNG